MCILEILKNFGGKKLKFQKTQISVALVAVIILASSMLLSGVPQTQAQTTSVPTIAYISAEPNPCGRGQTLVVSFWVLPIPPSAADIYHNFYVDVTKPDGSVQAMGPYDSQTIGTAYFTLNPDQTGTWTFDFSYPGETIRNMEIQPAQASTTCLVQEQAVQPYPSTPLPTGYWTRPIYGNNREWARIAGNWLQRGYDATGRLWDSVGVYNPYSQAPKAAHVMWTSPLRMGGIIGGATDHTFYSGLSYEWMEDSSTASTKAPSD